MCEGVLRALENTCSAGAVRDAARADGMRPMWRDALEKARLGLTTLEELARVISVDLDDADGPTAALIPVLRASA